MVSLRISGIVHTRIPTAKGWKKFTIDLKAAKVYEGEAEAACTFKMDEADVLQLIAGKADPMQLFMEGKMELDGDTDVAMKLGKVLKSLGGKM